MSQHPVRDIMSSFARPDASMSLLNNVMDHSLDDGYAEAAARRGSGSGPELQPSLRAKLGRATGLLLVALVVTVGAAQARVDAPTLAKERQELIDRIEDGTADADALYRQVDVLRRTVSARQREVLREHGGGRGELVGLLAGATPVEGPGVKLVVDDARSAERDGAGTPRSSSFADTGRVRDRDLQRVINGLWQSGAEAVSVNGQRLTSLSAVRAAGEAILVDNKPLTPPYTLLAVGDGPRLSRTFRDSADGQYLQVLRESYDIRTSIAVQKTVELPAAPSLIVRRAGPVKTGETAS